METLKKIIQFLAPLPIWLRSVIVALVAALIIALSMVSCGVTQIVNNTEGTGNCNSVTVTPSTSTSVSTDATLNLP